MTAAMEEVTMVGVSLAALDAFQAEHAACTYPVEGQETPFAALTTEQVVELIIKPETAKHGEDTYTALIATRAASAQKSGAEAAPRPLVGRATVFVSHAWLCLFADTVAAVRSHLRASPDADEQYCWIDVFVGSQHKLAQAPDLPLKWWQGTFRHAVASIGRTMLVLSPWEAPASLTRAWCLWEIFSTLDGASVLDLVLPPSQNAELLEALETRFDEVVTALCRIDVRNALAGRDSDRIAILAAVEEGAGVGAVNARVHDRLRGWLVTQARAMVAARRAASGEAHPTTLRAEVLLAQLLRQDGHNDDAAVLLRRVVQCRKATLGAAHDDTLTATFLLAQNATSGMPHNAKSLYEEVLTHRQAAQGDAHPETLLCLGQLASLVPSALNTVLAEKLAREALRRSRAAHGNDHRVTLENVYILAEVMRNVARCGHTDGTSNFLSGNQDAKLRAAAFAEAESLLRASVIGFAALLGPRHPETLVAMHSHAHALLDVRPAEEDDGATVAAARAEARAQMQLVLSISREVDGEGHPSMLAYCLTLANLLARDDAVDEAVPLYEACVRNRRDAAGTIRRSSVSACVAYSRMLVRAGRYAEAEPLQRDILEEKTAMLGLAFCASLSFVNDLVTTLRAQGKHAEAEAELLLASAAVADERRRASAAPPGDDAFEG